MILPLVPITRAIKKGNHLIYYFPSRASKFLKLNTWTNTWQIVDSHIMGKLIFFQVYSANGIGTHNTI